MPALRRTARLLPGVVALAVALAPACDDTIFHGGSVSLAVEGNDWCTVTAIFDAACVSCHNAGAFLGELDLQTDPYNALVGVVSTTDTCGGRTQVIPGDKENSLLYQKVAGTHDCGELMPLGGALDQASIDAIGAWIDAGATQECATTDTGTTATTPTDVPTDFCAVQGVFADSCLTGCHAADAASGWTDAAGNPGIIDLETDPYGVLVNAPSPAFPELIEVIPGDPDNSFLYQKVAGTMPKGTGASMPYGTTLSGAPLETIRGWIANGATDQCQ